MTWRRSSAALLLAGVVCGSFGVVARAAERGIDPGWHEEKMRTDLKIAEALDRSNGPDYVSAIAIVRASGRPRPVVHLQTGQMVIGYYRKPGRGVAPHESAEDGVRLLERASTEGGEGREIAPERLTRIFERGVGPPDRIAIKPNARIASCWRRVDGDTHADPRACIALRRTVGR